MKSTEVRIRLKGLKIRQWRLAAAIGIGEATLVRWLRDVELREERAKRITDALKRLERERDSV